MGMYMPYVHDRMFDEIPAKNTVYIHRDMVLVNPMHVVFIARHKARSKGQALQQVGVQV
jgi:hypothetical protein